MKCILHSRYIRNNISRLDEFKKYSSNVPKFLHNRPKPFIEHCLKSLPPQKWLDKEDIKSITPGSVYEVLSESSDGVHKIDFSAPSCTCLAWEQKHWPCKHMLVLLTESEDVSWENFPEFYRNHPVFCLDNSVCTLTDSQDTSHKNANPSEFNDISIHSTPVEPFLKGKTVQTLRDDCSHSLKEIQNLLHLTDDSDKLLLVKGKLNNCREEIEILIPTYEGLRRIPKIADHVIHKESGQIHQVKSGGKGKSM